jgi:hypothetical protein
MQLYKIFFEKLGSHSLRIQNLLVLYSYFLRFLALNKFEILSLSTENRLPIQAMLSEVTRIPKVSLIAEWSMDSAKINEIERVFSCIKNS